MSNDQLECPRWSLVLGHLLVIEAWSLVISLGHPRRRNVYQPRQLSRRRVDQLDRQAIRIFWALKHFREPLRLIRTRSEDYYLSGAIDERRGKCNPPGVQLGDKIGYAAMVGFFQRRSFR